MFVHQTTPQGNAIVDIYGKGDTNPQGPVGLPQNLLSQKHQRTKMIEDDQEMHNYQRGVLIDHECNERFFEHELPYQQGGAHASARFNLSNNGSKYSSEPDMPEVFLGEYYRDPNSIMYEPDKSAMAKQDYWRVSRYKPWGKDADHSIPDKIRSAPQAIKDRRDAFHLTGKRLKNFKTSVGNVNGHGFRKPLTDGISQIDMVHAELTPELGLQNEPSRYNHTVIASNSYPSGWQQTPDHVWNIAEYGARPYANLANSAYNQQKANHYSLEDHDPIIEFQGVKVPKSLVILKKRHLAEYVEHDHKPGILPFEHKSPIRQKVQMKQGVRPPDGILTHRAGQSLVASVTKRKERVEGRATDMINLDGKFEESMEGSDNKKQAKHGNNRKALDGEEMDGKLHESAQAANYANATPVRVNNHNSKVGMKFSDVHVTPNRKVVKHSKNVRVTDYNHKFGDSHAESARSGGRKDRRGKSQKMFNLDSKLDEEGSTLRTQHRRSPNMKSNFLSYQAELDGQNHINAEI